MVHYPDDDALEARAPASGAVPPGEPPLHTVADRGYTSSGSKAILMRGNARVTRGRASRTRPGGETETGEMRVTARMSPADRSGCWSRQR
ncbi:MAG: LPS export ABC transporter periplasmic protein LptC [Comamonadaceae bacterium]|nr:LPS export ABC transporter periplasmic protein LptC [Comamonadaceae bacterium]